MLAIYLSPVYILINFYFVRWLLRWLKACNTVTSHPWIKYPVIGIYIFFASSILTGFLLPHCFLERLLKRIGNYWYGVTLYTALTIMTADIIRNILKRCRFVNKEKLHSRKTFVTSGAVCLIIIAATSLYGVINARIIRTTSYEITVDKPYASRQLNIVLAADLHMGYNIGRSHIRQMVDKINACNPDLVVIAGDIFDNDYDALDNPEELIEILSGIKSKYGVYACYGNHDIKEKVLAGFTFKNKNEKPVSDSRMDEFLEKAGIKLLKDEYVLIDDSFYLYGRPDAERPGRDITVRKTPEEIVSQLDTSKPIIVIDHEPKELSELSAAGVDIDLCGHTHDGQLFPLNIINGIIWENPCGFLKKGNMSNIVTSGVGLYGPFMRVGTIPEICSIKVNFR